MHMIFRTLWHALFVGSRGRRLGVAEVSRSRFRVWPTDVDLLGHMNNGKYLSIMDVGRFDLIQRIGILDVFKREGWYPVVVGQTISYRKSLNPWKRFWIESRIVGFDDQAVFIEQRFVRREEAPGSAAGSGPRSPQIYARAIVRGRILRRSGGTVPIDEVMAKCGADPSMFDLPDWVVEWGRRTRLPSLRADAASVWE